MTLPEELRQCAKNIACFFGHERSAEVMLKAAELIEAHCLDAPAVEVVPVAGDKE